MSKRLLAEGQTCSHYPIIEYLYWILSSRVTPRRGWKTRLNTYHAAGVSWRHVNTFLKMLKNVNILEFDDDI